MNPICVKICVFLKRKTDLRNRINPTGPCTTELIQHLVHPIVHPRSILGGVDLLVRLTCYLLLCSTSFSFALYILKTLVLILDLNLRKSVFELESIEFGTFGT